ARPGWRGHADPDQEGDQTQEDTRSSAGHRRLSLCVRGSVGQGRGRRAVPCRNLAVLCPHEGDQSKRFPAEVRVKTGVVVLHNKKEATPPRSGGVWGLWA